MPVLYAEGAAKRKAVAKHAVFHPATLPQKTHAGAAGADLPADDCETRNEEAGDRLAEHRARMRQAFLNIAGFACKARTN